jgi:hypothetical protein
MCSCLPANSAGLMATWDGNPDGEDASGPGCVQDDSRDTLQPQAGLMRFAMPRDRSLLSARFRPISSRLPVLVSLKASRDR